MRRNLGTYHFPLSRQGHASVLQQRPQFTALVHFANDVASTNQFTLDVELRDRRPICVVLDALAQRVVFKHVHRRKRYAELRQDLSIDQDDLNLAASSDPPVASPSL